LRLNLLPRERRFYDLFERNSENIVSAAALLCELLKDPSSPEGRQDRISELEHEADEITHEIVRSLNRVFVTPFDREDIYALASGLDDVLDFIKEASDKHHLYDLRESVPSAVELGALLLQSSQQLRDAIVKLQSLKGLEPHWIEVNRIENQGDQVSRQAIGELFRNDADPIEVMKLKDVYEVLENALDRCEDVANVLENIVIKNA
jgi:predicted phosphate transport protein (TIGR00153 family)